MTVKLYMPVPFDRFKQEGEMIGRMVIEYGDLEWDLCLLVSHVMQDIDIAVKTLYRSRDEALRIDMADGLIRHRINPKVKQMYETTLAHMRVCLALRSRYAHANWVDAAPDKLCFIDTNELANDSNPIDPNNLPLYHLDMRIIKDQARFFKEIMQNMRYLNMEVQYLLGLADLTGFHYVRNILRPKMAARLEA
ncbi:hypothetical protein [Novosphingobium sp. Chol11]|uniref:hypothetical protein n=1 Tax=Novosphingobium sp. Chol11 TaxID=1385763 RepID=UPI0026014486|nr:hypothetical protein [Novosphingobium sp. Chol11]